MNDDKTPAVPIWAEAGPTQADDETATLPAKAGTRRRTAGAAIVGSLIVGGAAGAAFFGPLTATAASPTATPTQAAATPGQQGQENQEVHGGPGGRHETVTDASVVAKAIGISETDLTTALQGGQTVAQVAKAHNVDVQKVIDALVADGTDELAAAVKAGTITQAQADAQKTEVSQRATDQVNGTLMGGPGGHGGPGHNDGTTTTP